MAEGKVVRLIISRQDGPDATPYEDTFEVPYRPNMNVISALMEVRRNPVNVKGEQTSPPQWEMKD